MTEPAQDSTRNNPSSIDEGPTGPSPAAGMPPLEPPPLAGERGRSNKPISPGFAKALPEEERPPQLYFAVAVASLATGFIFSLLFGGATGLGFNIAIGVMVFFAGWFWIARETPAPAWRKICAVTAIVYGVAMALRASDILFTVNLLVATGFTALACTPSYAPMMKRAWATLIDLTHVGFNFFFGWIFMFVEFPWSKLKVDTRSSGVTSRVLVGVAISIPFLFVFGMLFAKAEAEFSALFEGIFSTIFSTLFSHFWIMFWTAVFSFGLLRTAFIGASIAENDTEASKSNLSIGLVESATVLSLLNALFFVFVITQLPYLFGGQGRVSSTPGLQWSEYARRGFFELAWVAALLIPTLMLFMNVTRAETPRQWKLLYGLCLGLTVLGGIVIVSALQRMLLYTANFGLTELRVYVSAFIVMLAVILVLLNVLNIMGRSRIFVPAALVIGVLFSIGIQVPNIQGAIATDIINRTLTGSGGDTGYLKQLSSDAVPTVVKSGLPDDQKKEIVQEIIGRSTKGHQRYHWLDQPLSVKRALGAAMSMSATPAQ